MWGDDDGRIDRHVRGEHNSTFDEFRVKPKAVGLKAVVARTRGSFNETRGIIAAQRARS